MTGYEELLTDANRENIIVTDQFDLSGTRLKGLYCDGTIVLNRDMCIESEKTCVLAEELGHHYTTVGNIMNQTDTANRKQEHRARLWAYNKLIGLQGIIKAYNAGCQNYHETAEYLDVTEEFLKEAITCYKNQYGSYAKVDNFTVVFEPSIAVIEFV